MIPKTPIVEMSQQRAYATYLFDYLSVTLLQVLQKYIGIVNSKSSGKMTVDSRKFLHLMFNMYKKNNHSNTIDCVFIYFDNI